MAYCVVVALGRLRQVGILGLKLLSLPHGAIVPADMGKPYRHLAPRSFPVIVRLAQIIQGG